ncbi:MAG: sugar transferase [bacterium]|nr:sugar transferase [bacterium]
MELVINRVEDLNRDLPPGINMVKIDIPNLCAKDIVNIVLRYVDFVDVYVKTDKLFSKLIKNGYLIFKKYQKADYLLKRVMDIFIGVLAIIGTAPLFLISSILTKLSSKGPVIFRQVRVNGIGKTFNFYKFRTMEASNEPKIHYNYIEKFIKDQLQNDLGIDCFAIACNDSIGVARNDRQPLLPSGRKVYKLTNDPRVTPIGRWLRILSIDELPQLINVLRGEMSLVGPRPPIPYEVELYEDWHKARLCTKPGITGLWQVMGRSLIPFNDMVVLDLYYATNKSLLTDLKILLRTIPMVLSLKGAY